ncbi:MAG: ABC transporter substrate-binding protein [Pseudomonadota bacterium]
MRSSILALAAASTIATAPSVLAFEAESTDPIKVMISDWSSILVHTEILNIILSTYGYNVETVVADDSARYPGFESGDLHIALETWETTQGEAFAKSVATGKVLDMGELGPQAKEDWWYPAYMAEACPGLPDWTALRDCADAFATADTAPNGRYLSGPVSWGGNDKERAEALGLPFEVVHAGTDAAMFAELKSAYERKAPIMLWIYEPHWAPAIYEGSYVAFPKSEPACYEDPAWGPNPNATFDCGKPEGWIKKMAWAGGEEIWPCAYEIVRNFEMTGQEVGTLVYKIDVEGMSVEDAAMEWATENEAEWRGWAACAEG